MLLLLWFCNTRTQRFTHTHTRRARARRHTCIHQTHTQAQQVRLVNAKAERAPTIHHVGGGSSTPMTMQMWLHKADSTYSRARPKNAHTRPGFRGEQSWWAPAFEPAQMQTHSQASLSLSLSNFHSAIQSKSDAWCISCVGLKNWEAWFEHASCRRKDNTAEGPESRNQVRCAQRIKVESHLAVCVSLCVFLCCVCNTWLGKLPT